MRIGVDYYPEHWDKSLWAQDAALMAQTGVKVVRIGEFAWSKMEPTNGVFDFTWLDEAIDTLAAQGLEVILGTPTNCPPLWLVEAHPDVTPMHWDGKRELPGIRGHRCYQSPVFRRYAGRIVEQLAKRYASHPAVTAWQIDNEVDANYCCCETCVSKFRSWLQAKYGTLDALNQAWHTDVWSGTYSAWTQVRPPVNDRPMTQHNPGLVLDFQRYAAESTTDYVRFQADLIRSIVPDAFITTNTWFCGHMPDYYGMFRDLDVVSYDNYPTTSPQPGDYATHALHLDLMRGVKRQNFWIMEQLSGMPGCWMPMGRTPAPGMLKGYALQAMAHGADTVIMFRWRNAIGGAEMYWHGLIDHSNVPGRRFREFASLCDTVKQLDFLDGTEIKADVAILYGMDNEYGFASQLQAEGMHYWEQLKAWHQAFASQGVNVDIIDENTDLSGYKIVVAPSMYVRSNAAVANLHAFAEAGGTVLLTCRSGVKDEHNACVMAPMPGDYRDMTGAVVSEYIAIGHAVQHVTMNGESYEITRWCDVLDAREAEIIAVYADGFFAGAPAVTKHSYGKGNVWYIGTVGLTALCRRIADRMMCDAGTEHIPNLPENVEITIRSKDSQRYGMVFNNTDCSRDVLLSGQVLQMEAYEMRIVHL